MTKYRIIKLPGRGFYLPQKSRFPFIWRSLIRVKEGLKSYQEAWEVLRAAEWKEFLGRVKIEKLRTVWEGHYNDLVAESAPRPPITEGPENQETKT